MFILDFTATLMRKMPADWTAYATQWLTRTAYQAPDNLVTFQWVAITTLGGVIVALANYIRILLADMRRMEKEHKAEILVLAEKNLTANHEMKETVKDNTEAISILGEKLERTGNRGARTTRKSNG